MRTEKSLLQHTEVASTSTAEEALYPPFFVCSVCLFLSFLRCSVASCQTGSTTTWPKHIIHIYTRSKAPESPHGDSLALAFCFAYPTRLSRASRIRQYIQPWTNCCPSLVDSSTWDHVYNRQWRRRRRRRTKGNTSTPWSAYSNELKGQAGRKDADSRVWQP